MYLAQVLLEEETGPIAMTKDFLYVAAYSRNANW